MKFRILVFLILFLPVGLYTSAQIVSESHSLEFVPTGSWQGYKNKPVPDELLVLGIKSNPTYSKHPELIQRFCACDSNEVLSVFLQLMEDEHKTQAGILVIEFTSAVLRDNYIGGLSSSGDDVVLTLGNNVIHIINFGDDDIERQKLLEEAQKFYEKKGAQVQAIRKQELTISVEEFEEILNDAKDDSKEPIRGREDAAVLHILELGEGFMVFYEDGTMRVCVECAQTQEVLDFLSQQPVDGVYLQTEQGLTIFQQIQGEGEAIFIDFEIEEGTWHFRNGVRLISNTFL